MVTKPITRDMHRNGGHLTCKSFAEYSGHLIPMLKGYIHTYIPWIQKCVMKTARCGTSHNTHIYIYSVKYHKHVTKILYIIFTYKKFIYRVKGMCVCMYFLKVALNFALSFLRTVTLGGKLLKIFMPAQNVLFFNSR